MGLCIPAHNRPGQPTLQAGGLAQNASCGILARKIFRQLGPERSWLPSLLLEGGLSSRGEALSMRPSAWGCFLSGRLLRGGAAHQGRSNLLSVREGCSAHHDECERWSVRKSKRFHLPNGQLADQGRVRTRSALPESSLGDTGSSRAAP